MARFALFKNNESGLIEQIVVTEADEDLTHQLTSADLRADFGAKVLVISDTESVEFR